MKDKYLIDFVTRKRGHFVHYNVDRKTMKFIQNLLLENDKYCMNCFIAFGRQDEEILNQIYNKCNNEYQYDVIARLYVGWKVIKNLINKTNAKNGAVYKNICKFETLFKNAELNEIFKNAADNHINFDSIDNLHKDHSLDVNIYLYDIEDKNLQHAVNDYLSCLYPHTLKVFTNKSQLCSHRTSTGLHITENADYSVNDISALKYHQAEF